MVYGQRPDKNDDWSWVDALHIAMPCFVRLGAFRTAGSVIVFCMGLPRHVPPRSSTSSGHGPFGDKAFKGALIGCLGLVIIGLLMVLVGGDAPRSVGASFMVLGVLGLVTGGAGLLAERLLQRRPPPRPDVRRGNGRSPYATDRSRVERQLRERP
jgi:hypothetical protein